VCGVRSMLGVMIMAVWLMKCAFAFRGMCVRLRAEDEVLRGRFGVEWEVYASRVPFKFLPGVV
jgi:protein-S-isoprenylcysteine O-methyltransferase Ste14